MNTHYRQGDVLLVATNSVPADASDITPERGPIVLAHGASTGHSHSLAREGVRMLAAGDRRFIRVETGAVLMHEEHGPVVLPPGVYETRDQAGAGIVQVEYTPGALRTVED